MPIRESLDCQNNIEVAQQLMARIFPWWTVRNMVIDDL